MVDDVTWMEIMSNGIDPETRIKKKILGVEIPSEVEQDTNNYLWLMLGFAIAFIGSKSGIPDSVWGGFTGVCIYKARGNGKQNGEKKNG